MKKVEEVFHEDFFSCVEFQTGKRKKENQEYFLLKIIFTHFFLSTYYNIIKKIIPQEKIVDSFFSLGQKIFSWKNFFFHSVPHVKQKHFGWKKTLIFLNYLFLDFKKTDQQIKNLSCPLASLP